MWSHFYFAWVNPDQTTFDPAFEREDETIRRAEIEHIEGGFATLTIQVENPQIGLLAPGRKTWAWLSYEEDSITTPLFFGQLIGIPTDILGKIVELVFIAKPLDYKEKKQALASTLKNLRHVDPIFIDPAKRDDPDTILEGYSALYHIDRVTHEITISDVLIGEDGNRNFQEAHVPAPSLKINLAQTPLRNVTVNATVGWSQSHNGRLGNVIQEQFQSYTGDGFISDWPQPNTSLQGGWFVTQSSAIDEGKVGEAESLTYSNEWTNNAETHNSGDTLSISWSYTNPFLTGTHVQGTISSFYQSGALNAHSDPQLNIQPRISEQFVRIPLWNITARMDLRYEANRQRTERVKFTLRADVQDILTDDEDISSEIITINGADVGLPVIDVLNWLSVSGQQVELGTVIVVNDNIDGTSYQIVTTAGVTGTTEPNFSEILGQTTNDGTAVWTSLGPTLFSSDIPDWRPEAVTPLGEVIFPEPPNVVPWHWLMPDEPPPTVGVSVSEGLIVKGSDGTFHIVTLSGTTDTSEPDWGGSRGDVTESGTAEFTSLGNTKPGANSYQIAVQAGTTGELEPVFSDVEGETTSDGSVIWSSLGKNGSLISRPIGNTSRRSYFTTNRGNLSLRYLINIARARLRIRARVVEISFECKVERMLDLSCRMNATIVDRRLPGGRARGKVISYSIIADGDTGSIIGNVTIGCAIGFGNATDLALAVIGTPDYADADLFDDVAEIPGVQEYVGASWTNFEKDLVFTPIADKKAIDEDDIVFPITKDDAIIRKEIKGSSIGEQEGAIISGIQVERLAMALGSFTPATLEEAMYLHALQQEKAQKGIQAQLKKHPRWLELELINLNGGPFEVHYDVTVGELRIPKMIDLEAPSA